MDQIDDLLPCPFCGAGRTQIVENDRPWLGTKYGPPVSISIRHWCDNPNGKLSRMMERVGRDLSDAKRAWNMRANKDTEIIDFIDCLMYIPDKSDNGWLVNGTTYPDFRSAMLSIMSENP
jgi:hypothetical protein